MSKRRADRELNQDNWDDDEIPVVTANVETINKNGIAGRKILRPSISRTMKPGTAGLFKGFTGLSGCNDGSSTFNFSFNSGVEVSDTVDNSKETDYLKKLQTLNQNLIEWITKHIKEDPYCILTPVFSDYEKHLNILNDKYPRFAPRSDEVSNGVQNLTTNRLNSSKSEGNLINNAPLSFMTTPVINSTSEQTSKPTFKFGMPPATVNLLQPKPEFRLSSSFPPSNIGNTSSPLTLTTNADDNEEYIPPKPVVSEINEPDSVFTIRCKLFYKIESEWRERGLGNLFIKPTGEDKFQLLIRADTNLGNILLNVLITREIPIKLQKNNITLVCVPSPTLPTLSQKQASSTDSAKPVPLLIRVKTEKEANELLLQFNKYRCFTTE